MVKSIYRRAILKLSGEALQGEGGHGLDSKSLLSIAKEIKEAKRLEVELALVIGGGNILRGELLAREGFTRSSADYMGILATVMNGLALQDVLEREGVVTRLQTAIEMRSFAEPYIRRRAIRHLEKGRVVIFAGGTGSPYFTTDTAAALRAVEIGADVLLKATKVNGVYSSDPMKDLKAKRFTRLRYMDLMERRLKVMDSTAISLCMENSLPIIVFSLWRKGNLKRVLLGHKVGTIVKEKR